MLKFQRNIIKTQFFVLVNVAIVKRLKANLDSILVAKTKAQKAEKGKKSKGKGKVSLKVEGENVSGIFKE